MGIFVIHDRKNNIPLFVGKVVNPSSAKPREKTHMINAIAVRTSDLDAEDLAHFNARPEDFFHMKNCSKVEYVNTEKVYFPCGTVDTKPIEDYKREHGDASLLGINGEQARWWCFLFGVVYYSSPSCILLLRYKYHLFLLSMHF